MGDAACRVLVALCEPFFNQVERVKVEHFANGFDVLVRKRFCIRLPARYHGLRVLFTVSKRNPERLLRKAGAFARLLQDFACSR